GCRAARLHAVRAGRTARDRRGPRPAPRRAPSRRMSALDLVMAVAELMLAAILIPVVVRAAQDRTRAAVDIAVFFALLDALLFRNVLGLANTPVLGVVSAALAYALPYLMLRLLSDFGTVPRGIVRV